LGVIVKQNSDANALYDALVKKVIEAYFQMPYRNLSELYFERGRKAEAAESCELDSLLLLAAHKTPTPLKLETYQGKIRNNFYGDLEI